MHVAWSYCQAAGFMDERKTNQLDKFKKEECWCTKKLH